MKFYDNEKYVKYFICYIIRNFNVYETNFFFFIKIRFFPFYFCDNLLEKLDVNHILRKMKIHQKRLNLKVILTFTVVLQKLMMFEIPITRLTMTAAFAVVIDSENL